MRLKAGARRGGPVVAISRGRHRPRRRNLHQEPADVRRRHRRRRRLPPASTWNNPEPEIVLVVKFTGPRSSARRSATTSTCAMSRAARRCCSARPRTTTRAARSARSCDCSTQRSRSTTCAAPKCRLTSRRRRRLHARRRLVDGGDQPRSRRAGRASSSTRGRQYPDGAALFLGTMFAPVDDRDAPGKGFTHKPGDIVSRRRRKARAAGQSHATLPGLSAVGFRRRAR